MLMALLANERMCVRGRVRKTTRKGEMKGRENKTKQENNLSMDRRTTEDEIKPRKDLKPTRIKIRHTAKTT